ncbi:hypothetical protein PHYSODRAFT_325658 [Phytophthora sojae]|uniref:Uncharacterized protein n=1 Tax=Phytophthora sojae (strain P6497) TaxID=1094619 RepID=G4YYG4_PHYSP|nr:hypothetical protein PHYSODRAFT_325658 [Phytophthora sojae]EGZ24551.1 hypothetical protein PHYSODRAFT_325658 [Phytophthora sojae]|eukprot:XP_009519839.1 hypothetical protein PHYSODRAFT_325658 [Phytophthora sojae]
MPCCLFTAAAITFEFQRLVVDAGAAAAKAHVRLCWQCGQSCVTGSSHTTVTHRSVVYVCGGGEVRGGRYLRGTSGFRTAAITFEFQRLVIDAGAAAAKAHVRLCWHCGQSHHRHPQGTHTHELARITADMGAENER